VIYYPRTFPIEGMVPEEMKSLIISVANIILQLKAIKEKLESYEKQILDFINTNGARNPVASLQQGQLPPPHLLSMHQPESPITKMQSHENQMNPQLQSMNLQGSVSSLVSTTQTGNANGGDWQEEAYQKVI
jgi:PAX-interacting protein 1